MFFFTKIHKNSINLDYARKVNLLNYQKLESVKGEILKLSFLHSEFKKQQRLKIKNLLVLEFVSLRKAFFKFELNKSKRKRIFIPKESRVILTRKFQDYFLYNFLKNAVGRIKNLPAFYSELTSNKQNIEIEALDLLARNTSYFNDLKDIQLQQFKINDFKNLIQKLGFYRVKL